MVYYFFYIEKVNKHGIYFNNINSKLIKFNNIKIFLLKNGGIHNLFPKIKIKKPISIFISNENILITVFTKEKLQLIYYKFGYFK